MNMIYAIYREDREDAHAWKVYELEKCETCNKFATVGNETPWLITGIGELPSHNTLEFMGFPTNISKYKVLKSEPSELYHNDETGLSCCDNCYCPSKEKVND